MNCSTDGKRKNTGMAASAITMLMLVVLTTGAVLPLQGQAESVHRQAPAATTQKWTAGFDDFGEPLNYTKSKITWTATATKLTVSTTLVGANPNKLYQVALMFYCNTFPSTFGQFPVQTISGNSCESLTRQGVTANRAEVELGVVLTDINGNGTVSVAVTKPAAGTYSLEFLLRDGSGCHISGGNGNCQVDFQSPGPTFGDSTAITIP
jgi:hypothetical protein